ncbi:hypothetical protein [uncultured Parasutterella sp.]|uniref:hypothetical protein n=1 Tax=uncultured Parasutterella sp. TaxID=1263098 RepID=UPI0025B557A6|nr:hypothetical protein [uncultured Parasutterella sp.]
MLKKLSLTLLAAVFFSFSAAPIQAAAEERSIAQKVGDTLHSIAKNLKEESGQNKIRHSPDEERKAEKKQEQSAKEHFNSDDAQPQERK